MNFLYFFFNFYHQFFKERKPKLRIYIDFKKVNEVMENEVYRLPNLLEILQSLGSSKYISTFDPTSEYHQIKINEVNRIKTTFSTNSSITRFYTRLSDLSSVPATFTHKMKSVLTGL